MTNPISKIQSEEKKAKKLILDALDKAKKLIEKSQKNYDEENEKAFEKFHATAQEKCEAAKKMTAEKYNKVYSQYTTQLNEIEKSYQQKKDNILDSCVDVFLKFVNN